MVSWSRTPKVPCEFCQQPITEPFRLRHYKSCYLHPNNKKDCHVCGKPVRFGGETCSRSCSNTHFRSGPDNPNWKDEKYRSTCFHHHDKRCLVCSEDVVVEAHHMDEDKTNNSPGNLVPLCPTHHAYWHSKHRHLIENQVTAYLQKWHEIHNMPITTDYPAPRNKWGNMPA